MARMKKTMETPGEFNIDDAFGVIDKLNPYATFLDDGALSNITDFIDTGSYTLNAQISGKLVDGGIPMGRVTMLAGPSQTGKSYIVQNVIRNAQKKGLHVVVFDTENAIDGEGAKRLGIDISKVKYVPTRSVEECRNIIQQFLDKIMEMRQKGKVLIVIDSLANLESEMQLNRMAKDNTSADMGSFAKACKSLLKTCTRMGAFTNTPILITNHIYDDPAAMFTQLVKAMPGGRTAVYLPTVTLQLSRSPIKPEEAWEEDKLTVGQKHQVGVILKSLSVKNRIVKPDIAVEMYLSFNNGLDRYHGLKDLAVGFGLIIQGGATYSLPDGTKLGYFKNFRTNKQFWDDMIPKIQEKIDEEWNYASYKEAVEANLSDEEAADLEQTVSNEESVESNDIPEEN